MDKAISIAPDPKAHKILSGFFLDTIQVGDELLQVVATLDSLFPVDVIFLERLLEEFMARPLRPVRWQTERRSA